MRILITYVIFFIFVGSSLSLAQVSLQKRINTQGQRIYQAAISPDNRIIATTGEDAQIILWDAETGAKLNILKGHEDKILSLAFSPNSSYLVSGGKDQKVKVWSVKAGNTYKTLSGHSATITSVAFSPNEEYVVSADQSNQIKIWDFQKEQALRVFTGHQKEITHVAFHPDGEKLASSSLDKTIKIWDVNQGQILHTLDVGKVTRSLDFSPDGKYLATGSDDKALRVWDASFAVKEPLKIFKKHNGWVQSLAFSPDSRFILSGGHDGKLILWDVASEKVIQDLESSAAIVMSTQFSANGKFMLSASLGNEFTVWNCESLKIIPNRGQAANNTQTSKNEPSEVQAIDLDFDLNTEAKNYLLVIGVSKYKHWDYLPNAVKDAKDVKNLLQEKYGFEPEDTYEIYDEEFNNDYLAATVEKIRKKVTSMDNLLIYYSGHGFYDPTYEEGYWVTSEAETSSTNNYFPNNRLLTFLKAIRTRHTFVVADACFSGALFGEQKRGYIENVESISSRWGLTSGNLEVVSDGKEGENSPFARYFMKFLLTNTHRKFTVSELIQYVKIAVANNSNQTPLGNPIKDVGHEGGEFVFHPRQ